MVGGEENVADYESPEGSEDGRWHLRTDKMLDQGSNKFYSNDTTWIDIPWMAQSSWISRRWRLPELRRAPSMLLKMAL